MKYQQDRQRTLFQIRADFGCCFKANAYAIILSHTSLGQFSPSQADIDLTEKLKEAGKVFEVTVLDHIIMTSDEYYSFADGGSCSLRCG